MNVLKAAAAATRSLQTRDELAMVLNLGPTWIRPDIYDLFNNNVIEVKGEYETPPGQGIVSLSIMFEACTSIASWLSMDKDNIAVSSPPPASILKP